jgi:phosphoribosylformimino-5-aminoimidazole carboxamide ribotide isomerase
VQRVILGTVAVRDPDLVRAACRDYPGRIAVGIDARDGRVAVEGWAETVDMSAMDLARRFEDAGAAAIGINNRNLHTFEEDLGTTERLRDRILASIPVVAASGVRTRADMKRMEACGVNAVLIGEALSSAVDPHAKARELLGR